jgi:hypothetical protein
MTHRIATLGLLAVLGTGPAFAEGGPRLLPTRDVTVAYEVAIPGQEPLHVRVAIEAGGERLQIVGEDLPTSFLVDRDTETAAIVLPMLKTYTRVSIARYDPTRTILRGAGFTPRGRDLIAGAMCTRWHAQSAQGSADACITADGVILDGTLTSDRKGTRGTIRAVRVSYGRLPPEIFAVPSNYTESPLGQAAAGFLK